MSIPGSANPLLLTSAVAGGYFISRSVRLNSADSAYFSRTPASSGNRKTWTWAGWVKRSGLGVNAALFGRQQSDDTNTLDIRFGTGDTLRLANWNTYILETAQVFRDTSAWFHLVVVLDTTQATANNRARMYVNGAEITQFGARSNPTQNVDLAINNTTLHHLGATVSGGSATYYFPGYLADIHFIDGQALDPSSFGEFSATTGVWMPKAYTGTYGTNGFHLDFSNNASAAALGTDSSGNGNTWTVNNLSVTAGAGNDSLVDVPANGSEVDTGLGNQVRGNYCTLNPLAAGPGATLSNGNLECTTNTADFGQSRGTIGVSTGKWYWEVSKVSGADICVGVVDASTSLSAFIGNAAKSYGYYGYDGKKVNNSTQSSYGTSYGVGDIIGVALDLDNGTIAFYKNNVAQGTAFTGLSGTFFPAASDDTGGNSGVYVFNFGARSFAYQAPAGYKCLNTASLPSPLVTKPSTVMDVALYAGNGSTQTITLPGGMSPDLVWIKGRSVGYGHRVFDTVRGTGGLLYTNATDAEVAQPNANDTFSSFNSNGFSLGAGIGLNQSSATYAAWCWDAGSSTVTNTQGSISSQVRANASAGFSVVGWSYPSGTPASTIGHGLGVKPGLIILKSRPNSYNWIIYHSAVGATKTLRFNTQAASTESDPWNNTEPTSSVFSIGAASWHGTGDMIAYCFAPVAGYSSMGSFSGGSGIFTYTGFRPKWLLIKQSSAVSSWIIYDTSRDTYNVMGNSLYPNLSDAEISSPPRIDFVSNGFVTRASSSSEPSWTGTVIYFAVAESPFQYARAR